MDLSSSYTLSFDNQYTEEMLRTFMACQYCKKVSARMKQLQCGHTICQKCATMTRKRKEDQWLIRCSSCRVVTVCYAENLSELRDVKTVQKLVDKARSNHDSAIYNSRMPPRWEDNLSISIVTGAKEKQEIRKVYESAKGRMQQCKEQRKQVQNYENKVQSAKMKIQRQIKESVESYVTAIRTHEDQLLVDLNQLFKEDFRPIEEAMDCLEMQMQSLKLVTECCSVAGRILKKGGAPMDINTFKKMVRDTMSKTKAGELPSVIQKSYRPKIFYKPNDDQYDELAERLGKLAARREKKKENKTRVEQERKTRGQIERKQEGKRIDYEEEEDEPIYDFPPEMMAKKAQHYNEEESFYDEIPFFTEEKSRSSQAKMESQSGVATSTPHTTTSGAPLGGTRSVPGGYTPDQQSSTSSAPPSPMMEQTSNTGYIPPAPPLPPHVLGSISTPKISQNPPPPPIVKNNYAPKAPAIEPQSTPTTISLLCQAMDNNTTALFAKRRLAINGDDSDFSDDQSISE